MLDIKELDLKGLEKILGEWGFPKFHAQQIFFWIYKKNVLDFLEMTDLPLKLREKLKEIFYICGLNLVEKLTSQDGTEKFLFQLKDKNYIEAVAIPTEKRLTGCISVQVGCKFSCKFCASGLLGFKRNLTVLEILDEILLLKKNASKTLSHLVFMGIGEPLDNYENVIKAIRIINSKDTFNIGARRITISTCGIIPAIKRLSDENLQVELSISLHSADDKTRSLLMPINKIYPLADLISTCKEYIQKTNRQITFEYILIKGINSDLPSAKKLTNILKGLRLCKVNLIPANPIKELNIEPPNKLEVLLFRDFLLKSGINVTLRRPRGRDIQASCGQLRLRYEK
jgi:23S rRNA (adenine2503-C2)-methyltransferase